MKPRTQLIRAIVGFPLFVVCWPFAMILTAVVLHGAEDREDYLTAREVSNKLWNHFMNPRP